MGDSTRKQAMKNTIVDIFGEQANRQSGRDIKEEMILKKAIQTEEFKESLARLITIRNLPHSILSWPEFWTVLLSINYMVRDVIHLTRNNIPTLLRDTFHLHKLALIKKLQKSLSWIHFSTDFWTSPTKTGFLAIVAHWADSESKQSETALLALRELKYRHGGQEQAEIFLQVKEEYQILPDMLGFFTMDNDTSNDRMLKEVQTVIPTFDPVFRRIRCNGHVINLAVQAFLFGPKQKESGQSQDDEEEAITLAIQNIEALAKSEALGQQSYDEISAQWREHGVLGKLHCLNIWSRGSTARYNTFVEAVGRAIPLPNETRWNSWERAIEVALSKRREISNWQDEHFDELQGNILSRDDWQELQDIHEILIPFRQVTKATEGEQDSLDDMQLSMEFLIQHYKEMKEKFYNNPHISARLMSSWFKFDKYYQLSDDTPVYAAAVLLHPSLRKKVLSDNWAHQAQYIDPAVEAARDMWLEHFKSSAPISKSPEIESQNSFKRWKAQKFGSSITEEFDSFIEVLLPYYISYKANYMIGSSTLYWRTLCTSMVAPT
jgi:hypothetical protein